MKIKKLTETAQVPTRATIASAGFDLYADLKKSVVIKFGEIQKIGTGIAIALQDENFVALVYARSGLATKFGIVPANCVGVIDSDYRGEVAVFLMNQQPGDFTINHGDRIAQMVITPVCLPLLEVVDELPETIRGVNGFGSTGK